MRLPRMSTRQLIVWIAIAALAIWAKGLHSTYIRYERKALQHAGNEALWKQSSSRVRMQYQKPDGSVVVLDILKQPDLKESPSFASKWKVIGRFDATAMADYNALLSAKYQRAKWHPWKAIPPDPPLPAGM